MGLGMKGEELHRLVQSMDDRERRLFRREAGQHLRLGKSNYLLLFEAVASMPAYDEQELAERLKSPALLRQLPSVITRLFLNLVEFIDKVEESPSIDRQLDAACSRIAILYDRGLYGSARKELKKAQALALRHENFLQLLRLSDLERNFFFSEHSTAIEPSKDAKAFRDKEYLQSLLQQVETKLNHFEALFYTKAGKAQQAAAAALLRRLPGRSVHQAIRKAKATAADLMLLDSIGLCAQLEGDFDLAFAAYSRMDSLWVSDPSKIADNAQLYVRYITSFLNSCLMKARYVEFRNLMANLKTVHFPRQADNLLLKEALLYLELLFCLNRFDYDRGTALGPEIERVLQAQKGRISGSRVITYCFNMCSLHFMKGEYSKANRWLVQLINIPLQDYRRDVQDFAPVFQLLLFVAMKDHDLVAVRLRARHRHRGGGTPSALESAILGLCNRFLRTSGAELQAAIATFREQLLAILQSGGQVAGAGECLFWAEGQLRGKLPGEVFKEYAQANQG